MNLDDDTRLEPPAVSFVQATICHDGSQIWAIDGRECLYHCRGIGSAWSPVSGRLSQIAVSGNGEHLWGVNSWNQPYYRKGFHGLWKPISGALSAACVTSAGSRVWGVDKQGHVWVCSREMEVLRRASSSC